MEDVSRFLDYGSLAVTAAYPRRLERRKDLGGVRWGGKVGRAIGVQ